MTQKHSQGLRIDIRALRLIQLLVVQELPEDVEHHVPAQGKISEQLLLLFRHNEL